MIEVQDISLFHLLQEFNNKRQSETWQTNVHIQLQKTDND